MDFCPIAHAKAYPFAIPDRSYVLDRDGWRFADGAPDVRGRHAVIASGSNASPDRLRNKYGPFPHLLDAPIPVTRARLHEFDAVYSAHFSDYGSIPATLAHVPGAVADVFVTWLTDAQLDRMHDTEQMGVNYDYAKLTGIQLLCENDAGFTSAHAYISRKGCLNRGGWPIPLAATRAEGRQGVAMTQEEVLEYARMKLAPQEDYEDFIRRQIDCAITRAERTAALSKDALPHGWSSLSIMTDAV